MPITLIFNESYQQPLFGANYFTGTCRPVTPGSLPNDPVFKIWFMQGGSDKFLKCVRYCLGEVRENITNRSFNFTEILAKKNITNDLALFDPYDPSTIFVVQPVEGQEA